MLARHLKYLGATAWSARQTIVTSSRTLTVGNLCAYQSSSRTICPAPPGAGPLGSSLPQHCPRTAFHSTVQPQGQRNLTSDQQNVPKSSESSSKEAEYASAKPFDAIPAYEKIPLLGISRDFTKFSPSKAVQFIQMRVGQLGKIFREKSAPGLPEFVFVVDPEDVAKVFRADGRHPRRFQINEWTDVRKELDIPLGLFLADGENWERQRKPMSKFMMIPRKVSEYHESFNEVALDLLELIRIEKGEGDMFIDVQNVLNRWSFESVCVFVLGKRLGCLQKEMPPDCEVFIEALHNLLNITQKLLFNLPFHKLWSTKNWKALSHSQKCLYDTAMSHIREKVAKVTEEEKRLFEEGGEDEDPPVGVDFITFMIHAGKMDLDTIATNAVDLMAAGVDTTSNTLAWALYCLATNPEVQEKLRSEVQAVVGSDKLVTPEHIAKMPYLHDCIRETQRFYPIAPNNSRILNEDIVLSGYRVPAGTYVVMPIRVTGTMEENFPEPEMFKPERWSRKNRDTPNVFGSLPFGFGVRMCVGRRVAELEMHITLAQLMKSFRVEYRDKQPLNFTQKLFVYPERRMDLAFVDLK